MPFWNPGDEITAEKLNKTGNFVNFIYGESISAGDAVYLASDGKVYKSQANVESKVDFVGFAIENGNANDVKAVQIAGKVDIFSGLTPGATYYLSNTAGAISTTPGTYRFRVGVAVSSTELFINPQKNDFTEVKVFTSSGTFTRPAYVKKVLVEVVGGGGGGAGTNVSSGYRAAVGGGGGGGYARKIIDISGVNSVEVTVGSGGAGGYHTPASNGGDGGNSSFGTYVIAYGGKGGKASSPYGGGDGGNASGGDINIPGKTGGQGFSATTDRPPFPCWGGSSALSVGEGKAYGGGGNGAYVDGYPATGQSGAPGVVIVYF